MAQPETAPAKTDSAYTKTDMIIVRATATVFWVGVGLLVAGIAGGGIGLALFAVIGLGGSAWSIWGKDKFSGYLRVPGYILHGVLAVLNLF
ncbi:hypothetical protein [Devosia sp.]|uniref:hypothetical protein n=1 Tax=Devosia sp. TaxID=1871048 RepID=UPI003265CDBD